MASCKECIYEPNCLSLISYGMGYDEISGKLLEDIDKRCKSFKNKSDFQEVSKIAKILAELFGDECPCNYNDVDEWLPYVCDYANTCDCPCHKGWEQFIKHYDTKMDGVNNA